MHTTKTHTPVISSPFTGTRFFFIDDDREIVFWGSKFTGKEIAYVDGQTISEKRTYGFKSIHSFDVDNDNYEIELEVTNPLTESMSCTLIKNGAHLKTTNYSLWKDKKSALKVFLTSFIVGAVTGFTVVSLMS
ncbi:hypothetical protein MHM98_15850 [Psychrobium sp. MM17-31]|uniref:hypothetical protein n=1 Tax=Psychrobium sp. MM17-31 TaxID=2917758 RepID=UPI001EF5A416|nr:hypothetical protein [Psychrobium sp. MM17-31]MCG7532805.1 hypothetical protein [Psychrobium sp. MM17-31]